VPKGKKKGEMTPAGADITKIWEGYKKRYSYARDIALSEILALITWVFGR
jgi:hypothetical protein